MADRCNVVNAKVVLLGGTVGKTSILLAYTGNKFNNGPYPTLQASLVSRTVYVEENLIQLSIWDTAGHERYDALAQIYYWNCQAAIVVYDITDKASFQKMKYWIDILKKRHGENIVLCIVGNKIDLEKNRTVLLWEAESYARLVGAVHYSVSAKENSGVQELFLNLSRNLIIRLAGSSIHTSGYILLKDDVGYVEENSLKQSFKKFFGSNSTVCVLQGELLKEYSNSQEKYTHMLHRDPSICLFCKDESLAPINKKEFMLLEGIENLDNRLLSFNTDQVQFGLSLLQGSKVNVTGIPSGSEESIEATIHYIGEVMGLRGIYFGVELIVNMDSIGIKRSKYEKVSLQGIDIIIFMLTNYVVVFLIVPEI